MGYQDCPCVNCDHKADGEKRVVCRKKCTEFTAWAFVPIGRITNRSTRR